jgi:hypothetical protein
MILVYAYTTKRHEALLVLETISGPLHPELSLVIQWTVWAPPNGGCAFTKYEGDSWGVVLYLDLHRAM